MRIKLSTVLSIVSFVGVAVTGYLAAKGGREAGKIEEKMDEYSLDDVTGKEKFKKTWKCYAPAIVMGIVTIGCGAYAKRLDTKEIIKLTGALGVATDRLAKLAREYDIYRGEVVGEIGPQKENEVYQRTQARIVKDTISGMEEGVYNFHIDWVGGKDMFFEATRSGVTLAMYEINRRLNDNEFGYPDPTVSDFFYQLSLPEMVSKETDDACWDREECYEMEQWWIHWDIIPYGKSDFEADKEPEYYDIVIDLYPKGSQENEEINLERRGTL